tara:strand:- start:199 stop:444 length:246 start_codon:yes stop_codon:yes gene_type:complete
MAEENPLMLNAYVAFFVMGWARVAGTYHPMHGIDQEGKARMVPNYVDSWGVDACMHYLRLAPESRLAGVDFLSEWMIENSR